MCFSKIALQIYNDRDIKNCLLYLVRYRRILKETNLEEDTVITGPRFTFVVTRGKELASTLPIPTPMKEPLLNVVESFVLKIFKWYEALSSFVCDDLDEYSSLCLRSDGTIDNLKTAQAMVKSQDANPIVRFRIACHYCLIADIQRLIGESPNICTRSIEAYPYYSPWLDYWTKTLPAISPPSAETALQLVEYIENEGQLMYLLQLGDRNLLTRIIWKNASSYDVVRVCLPRMHKDDLKIVFSDSDFKGMLLLNLLFSSPFFLDVVRQMFEYLEGFDIYQFFTLLDFDRNERELILDDRNPIRDTLTKFWNECPAELKAKAERSFSLIKIDFKNIQLTPPRLDAYIIGDITLPTISPPCTETASLLVRHIGNEGQLLYLLQSDKDLLKRIFCCRSSRQK
ncbi:hypothetical protein CEXT_76981 [Caerostris extrusa]|uniref:Uncharacterized protein n=1 Tax=Caerostris extrusa TaxID=172846 RepID=A0AAV4XXL8_CAEEX|nr:hypothetical protein CEXT_76981 [Caerostris extrusa]